MNPKEICFLAQEEELTNSVSPDTIFAANSAFFSRLRGLDGASNLELRDGKLLLYRDRGG